MPRPAIFSSLNDGSSSNGNASSAQYLLMIGWTFVSMSARTFLTIASSSAGKSLAKSKKSLLGAGSGLCSVAALRGDAAGGGVATVVMAIPFKAGSSPAVCLLTHSAERNRGAKLGVVQPVGVAARGEGA